MNELRDLAKNVAPTVLCVLETQVHKAMVESLKSTLGFDCSFAVSTAGRSGGLASSGIIKQEWKFYCILSIALIPYLRMGEPWRLTCVYGEAQVADRHKT